MGFFGFFIIVVLGFVVVLVFNVTHVTRMQTGRAQRRELRNSYHFHLLLWVNKLKYVYSPNLILNLKLFPFKLWCAANCYSGWWLHKHASDYLVTYSRIITLFFRRGNAALGNEHLHLSNISYCNCSSSKTEKFIIIWWKIGFR